MEHVMFVRKLKKENRDEYIRIHKEACMELLKTITNAGIKFIRICFYISQV